MGGGVTLGMMLSFNRFQAFKHLPFKLCISTQTPSPEVNSKSYPNSHYLLFKLHKDMSSPITVVYRGRKPIKMTLFLLIIGVTLPFCLSISIRTCFAEDSSPVQDTCPTAQREQIMPFINGFPCKNPNTIMPSDFKTSKLKYAGDTNNDIRSSMNMITAADFPGLNTLGISIARTDLGVDGVVLLHSHPRASELLYVSSGVVTVAFIDTGNVVFQRRIGEGEVFLFPRGLLHFFFNAGFDMATTFSVFNSQNPGVVSIMGAMFQPDSEDEIMGRMVSWLRSLSMINGTSELQQS